MNNNQSPVRTGRDLSLSEKFKTNHNTAPFAQIKLEDYQSAFEENIAKARAEVDEITNNPETPTFENTIEALDYSGEALDRLSSIFFNLHFVICFSRIQIEENWRQAV